jgi:hypothetical protein
MIFMEKILLLYSTNPLPCSKKKLKKGIWIEKHVINFFPQNNSGAHLFSLELRRHDP